MIFDYCGIDKSNVVENFDINNVPDTYIFMLQDLVCCNRIIGIRADSELTKKLHILILSNIHLIIGYFMIPVKNIFFYK